MKVYRQLGLVLHAGCRTTWRRARCRPTPASAAPTTSTRQLTQPIPDGTLAGRHDGALPAAGRVADQIDPNVKAMYVNEALGGFEYEAAPGLNVGVRYIHRDIPRVLEDVQPFPIVAFDLGVPGTQTRQLRADQPWPEHRRCRAISAPSFESADPSATTPSRSPPTSASPTAGRCRRPIAIRGCAGTYEGFFRDDNGQSDPGITSLFDFPTNDPSYTSIGVPQFGYSGDVRYLGALGEGPLPLDRPHQFKVVRELLRSTWA